MSKLEEKAIGFGNYMQSWQAAAFIVNEEECLYSSYSRCQMYKIADQEGKSMVTMSEKDGYEFKARVMEVWTFDE